MMLKGNYDQHSDVLYLYKDEPRPALTEDGPDGLMLRFAIEDDAPCGVTILGYRRIWSQHKERLVTRVSEFLREKKSSARELLDTIDPMDRDHG